MIRLKILSFLFACLFPFIAFAGGKRVKSPLKIKLVVCHEIDGDSSLSPIYEVEGTFMNMSSKIPVEGVEVTIINKRNNHFQVRMTGRDGKFRFALHDESVYSIEGSKPRYFDSEQVNISTIGKQKFERLEMDMPIERMELNHPYIIKEIVFDVNGWELNEESHDALEKLHQMLLKNPSIKIEVGVHTDARGDDQYNLHLTEKRAISILNKLRQLGIRGNRITTKGYGESTLINHCGNTVRCNSPEHMQNRRVSFTILSF